MESGEEGDTVSFSEKVRRLGIDVDVDGTLGTSR